MNLSFQKISVTGCALVGLALVFASALLHAADEPPVDDRVMFDDFKINATASRCGCPSTAARKQPRFFDRWPSGSG